MLTRSVGFSSQAWERPMTRPRSCVWSTKDRSSWMILLLNAFPLKSPSLTQTAPRFEICWECEAASPTLPVYQPG